jgi:hypothetical protein
VVIDLIDEKTQFDEGNLLAFHVKTSTSDVFTL